MAARAWNETAVTRRAALRILGGSALGAGLLSVPFGARAVRAGTGPAPRAERLLILNLNGGIRSSAAFHASATESLNPWGMLGGGRRLRLGALLGDAIRDPRLAPGDVAETPLPDGAYRLGPDWDHLRLPRIAEAAADFAVLGTWNDRRGDHITSQAEETTGGTRNDPGILTRIHRALEARTGPLETPPFGLGLAETVLLGAAPGDAARFAPVELTGSGELPGVSQLPARLLERVGGRWVDSEGMFAALDREALARLGGSNLVLGDAHAFLRANLRRLGSRLAQSWVDIGNPAGAEGEVMLSGRTAPLTNSMLAELFLRSLPPDPSDPERSRPLPDELVAQTPRSVDAYNLAFAIRLLQLGAPAVAIEIETFDFHSDERGQAPDLYRTMARWWASLGWLLARLDDPIAPGRPMLERTLCATMSDFGRNRAAQRGFNDGDGSDHGGDPACFYLAHAIMGAGIAGDRIVGDVETDGSAAYDATRAGEMYGTKRFLATLLDALGLDAASPTWGFPDDPPIARLWNG